MEYHFKQKELTGIFRITLTKPNNRVTEKLGREGLELFTFSAKLVRVYLYGTKEQPY